MLKKYYLESADSEIVVAKRKGTRNLRLSVRSDGVIRLTVPYGVSERYITNFLQEKTEWINKHKKPVHLLVNEQHIGKSYRLIFEPKPIDKVKTRIKQNEVHISYPESQSEDSTEVQQKAITAAEKALKSEAERLLPQRLEYLSEKFNLPYKSVKVKKLKSRWGSCDTYNNITLSFYLTQLDWSLIDYVLLHELTHTLHKHHQSDFWDKLESILPDYKDRRKILKAQPTNIFATNF